MCWVAFYSINNFKNAVNLDKLALIVNNGEDCSSCQNTFPSFFLVGVILSLHTISRYLLVSSVSLVCTVEIALHYWNKNILIVVVIDPCTSGVSLHVNAEKLGSAMLTRVITRCLLIWALF